MFSDCWRRREDKRPRRQHFNNLVVCSLLTSSARRNFPNSRWWRSRMEEPCSLASGLPDLLDVHEFVMLTPPDLTPHYHMLWAFHTHDLLCQQFLAIVSAKTQCLGNWRLVMSQRALPHSQTSRFLLPPAVLTWLGTSCWSPCGRYRGGTLRWSWPWPPGRYSSASTHPSEHTHTVQQWFPFGLPSEIIWAAVTVRKFVPLAAWTWSGPRWSHGASCGRWFFCSLYWPST